MIYSRLLLNKCHFTTLVLKTRFWRKGLKASYVLRITLKLQNTYNSLKLLGDILLRKNQKFQMSLKNKMSRKCLPKDERMSRLSQLSYHLLIRRLLPVIPEGSQDISCKGPKKLFLSSLYGIIVRHNKN